MNYIIDNNIIFNPDLQEITSCSTKRKIKLHYTSSRCLELLIKEHGNIVPQQEIIEYGWENRAKGVSSPAYYQCMVNLRKSLKELGTVDVIRTIPRKGIVLLSECAITTMLNENNTLLEKRNQPDSEPVDDEKAVLAVDKHNEEGSQNDVAPLSVMPEKNNQPISGFTAALFSLCYKRKYYTLGAGLLMMIGIGAIIVGWQQAQPLLPGFERVVTNGPCRVYANSPYLTTEHISAFMDKHHIACERDKEIYLSHSINIKGVSLFEYNNKNQSVISSKYMEVM
ncbi:hypothetical protein PMPD1_3457 [Paramixta manurensis]|uniref:OmpR/PhoB-type domain-containing protein n=1 Tax=Paramixta manurensis TaxID=2740817 RepID=A0A6M8UFK2_9GAMM|nr:hypothetical protein PMPD1_3457 [Erwiniaceae bacterium PD-1]